MEQAASIHLMQVVWNKFEDRLTDFISAFLQEFRMYDDIFLHSMAQFLYLLSGDPAFSTALPFRSHNIVRRAIEEMKTEGFMEDHTKQELKKYTTECEKLLQLSSRCIELCTNFLVPYWEDRACPFSKPSCPGARRNSWFILPTWWDSILLQWKWCPSQKNATLCSWWYEQ